MSERIAKLEKAADTLRFVHAQMHARKLDHLMQDMDNLIDRVLAELDDNEKQPKPDYCKQPKQMCQRCCYALHGKDCQGVYIKQRKQEEK